jgi:hypothetical protein
MAELPSGDDIHMSCNLPLSRRRIGVVMLAALAAALLSGPQTLLAASGYWKYDGSQITPTNEYYATVKPLPGRVYELKATPGFQAGPGDGKGALDLFFKTDDADRVQFLCTSTLNFGANAQLATLVPYQKVMFEVSIVVGGNDKCRAMPATGVGQISFGNGDAFVEAKTQFGQTASARGETTIPPGAPRDTLVIRVSSVLSQLGAMREEMRLNYVWVEGPPPLPPPPPAASRFAAILGSTLTVREMAGGTVYDGTWTRRAGTDVFDAVWNGAVRDVIEIESVNGNQIVLYRHGNAGRYSGTLSADGSRVTGTANWYAAGWSWSATVSGRSSR